MFRKKEWIDETLSVISGNQGDLHVAIHSFPFRKEKHGGRWRYRYRNFGNDFLRELTEKQLPDFETIVATLTQGKIIEASVRVGGLPEIIVEIQGRPSSYKQQFFSDLADAIIDAFNKNGIKP